MQNRLSLADLKAKEGGKVVVNAEVFTGGNDCYCHDIPPSLPKDRY